MNNPQHERVCPYCGLPTYPLAYHEGRVDCLAAGAPEDLPNDGIQRFTDGVLQRSASSRSSNSSP